jgi:Fic family protein
MIGFNVSKHPGRWRPGQIWVEQEATGKVVYEGPDPELVPALMAELVDSLNAKNDLPVMVRAALAHLNLVMIHPFSDGNGRMGRALQTLVLAREGILDPTFSSIEEYLGRNTPEYYEVLGQVGQGAWHPKNDPLPWIKFCLVAHYRQAETLLRRSKEVTRMWGEIEAELRKRKLNERMTHALMDAAHRIRVRNSAYRKSVEVSDEVASRDLKALVSEGLLVPQGERRGRCYVAGEWLLKLYRDTREPRPDTDDPFIVHQPEPQTLPLLFDSPTDFAKNNG